MRGLMFMFYFILGLPIIFIGAFAHLVIFWYKYGWHSEGHFKTDPLDRL